MNLRQLTYFRAVVEHRSLAAAADVLNVAQPNLSVAIKQLEELWGVTLFERSGRGLVVTDTGRALYERAAELLGGASALDQEMRAIGRGFTSRLHVGFTQMSIEAIATMVSNMRDDGNAVSFSLQQGEPQLLETMVEARQLDFAVTHMPVANPALAVEALAPLTMALLCREGDDRWQSDKEVTLDMLANVPLIVLRRRSGMGIYERIVEAFSVAGIALSVVADCNDASAIYPLVERNVGVGLLPVHTPHVPRPGFSIYTVTLASVPGSLALIYPRGRRLLPAVQRAMDLCRTTLRAR
ncbi:LysR family transcriptional regulator [Bradyrhizobium sp. dw_411]|uniref:LysR family transcriptional regulator n=1 Tax=Bradyrhizobium sp. dw_411 TaxID=2720082 RepID=UPI001BCE5D15|nr:LysR family transcriptional regulator [Bradyrhizobium sp. dw_411]